VYACRAPTGTVAVSALKQFLIWARVLLKSSGPVTPIVVRTDQAARSWVEFLPSMFDLFSRNTRLV
jgi:hypothetical protein